MKQFLLVVIFVFTLPIYGQEPGSTNNPGLTSTANERGSYIARLISPENLPNIVLIFVGIGGIIVAIRTLNHMRESSETQLQAYVFVEGASIVDGSVADPPQPEKVNTPFAAMLMKNFGQTPAYRVVSWAQLAVVPVVNNEEPMLMVPPLAERFTNTLGPSANFNKGIWFDRSLGAGEIADIVAGRRAIYLYGRIEYEDAFGMERFTTFRLHYTGQYPPPLNSILLFSESGNDAD
jgi:hypothetical protein